MPERKILPAVKTPVKLTPVDNGTFDKFFLDHRGEKSLIVHDGLYRFSDHEWIDLPPLFPIQLYITYGPTALNDRGDSRWL
jgi:hypothetical protein